MLEVGQPFLEDNGGQGQVAVHQRLPPVKLPVGSRIAEFEMDVFIDEVGKGRNIGIVDDDPAALGKRALAFLEEQDGIVYVVKHPPHHDVFQGTLPERQLRGVADNIEAGHL